MGWLGITTAAEVYHMHNLAFCSHALFSASFDCVFYYRFFNINNSYCLTVKILTNYLENLDLDR